MPINYAYEKSSSINGGEFSPDADKNVVMSSPPLRMLSRTKPEIIKVI